MVKKVTAPRMGEGVEEVTLVKWLKQVGDPIEELEAIVEVETDKVVTELPSPGNGVVLQILVGEGSAVRVGEILAWVGNPGEEIPQTFEKSPSKKSADKNVPEREELTQADMRNFEKNEFLSPLVRKMIAEHDLDVDAIRGSGKNGRITKQDVANYLASAKATPSADGVKATIATEVKKGPQSGLHPISSIRRTIAERMIASQQTSAHVLTVMEADLSRVSAHRALNKPLFEQDGIRLTLTAYFIAAITAGLKANPKVNASWTDDGLMIHPGIHIGMAVSLGDEGLIVPVIKHADTLSLLGIAQQVNDLAERARTKQLKADEVRGGTFSLTNHGMSGSLFATPIITQPQVGILGTGMVQKRAVVITDANGNDMLAIRPMVYLSFVFDHRVLDGEGADRFLATVVHTLENWS
jgi:2-oxoglutarate dehydrogenase E2 component (dihydrolipoamide succinyltransferase)